MSRYRSMLRVFGALHRRGIAKTRRDFAAYKVVKLPAKPPEQVHRTTGITDLTGVSIRFSR
jgi:hypothetical protein